MLSSIFSWDTLWYLLVVLYVPACFGLVVIVLLQKGKGTGFAGAFGAGAGPGADTVFGARAGQTLPVRLTYVAAGIFVFISLSMSLISSRVGRGKAPELLQNTGGSGPAAEVTTGLDDLGLGKGHQGAGSDSSAPAAPATPAPANAATTPASAPQAAPATAAQAPAAAAPAPSAPVEQKPAEPAAPK